MNVSSGASTTQVNGKWNPIEFVFVNDEEFDDFLSKQARARYMTQKGVKKARIIGQRSATKSVRRNREKQSWTKTFQCGE